MAGSGADLGLADLVGGPSTDPDRLQELLAEHYPIYIKGTVSIVTGAETLERLDKLMAYSLAAFTWMAMREGRVQWPRLFPSLYREAVPFYRDDAFCTVAELLTSESRAGAVGRCLRFRPFPTQPDCGDRCVRPRARPRSPAWA
jgi:hypothetical protein